MLTKKILPLCDKQVIAITYTSGDVRYEGKNKEPVWLLDRDVCLFVVITSY